MDMKHTSYWYVKNTFNSLSKDQCNIHMSNYLRCLVPIDKHIIVQLRQCHFYFRKFSFFLCLHEVSVSTVWITYLLFCYWCENFICESGRYTHSWLLTLLYSRQSQTLATCIHSTAFRTQVDGAPWWLWHCTIRTPLLHQ